ncbi:hypothetical protein ACFLVX_04055 [Chloroflexota bacterium]
MRKALVFERALHSWDKWRDSVACGRNVLQFHQSPPSLEKMRNVANRALSEMEFPSCPLFELYWICCVFADYETARGFNFDKLVLPDWFPFPSGFKWDKFGFASNKHLDFKGKRIYPPVVWNEADRKFWFAKDPVLRGLSGKERAMRFKNYPDRDFKMVLPVDHTVRQYVKRGRPITTNLYGETSIE